MKYKKVQLIQQQLVKKDKSDKYTKLQRLIAKWFKLELAETYRHFYKIQYKGETRLVADDIVVNDQGYIFIVIQELNRLATLVSKDATVTPPIMWGKLRILIRKGSKTKNN